MKLRFSIAHFSVKHRKPFKNSFCPSRRHRRQTASRCLANFLFSLPQTLKNSLSSHTRAAQTLRRLGGRQPLCGIGVTSRITTMCNPAAAKARTADSRPEPGPCTRTSQLFIPYWSRATPAAASEACCAAYGVPLREPLKPIAPADDQHITRPSVSVMVICVLLNDAAICTYPCGTTRRSRFFLNSFLRFVAAAGFAGAPVSGVAPAAFGSFGTFHSIPSLNSRDRKSGGKLPHSKNSRPERLGRLADRLLLRCDGAAPRTLAGACVGMRALAAHRKIPAVANPAIGLNFNQPADVHLDLLAEIAFHPAFLLDGLAKMIHFLFGQVADLLGMIHAGLCREFLRALLPDAVDRSQSNPQPFLNRKINTCYACHEKFLLKASPEKFYPWRCLCFGLVQITRTTPRR